MKNVRYIFWLIGLMLVLGSATTALFVFLPRFIQWETSAILLNGMSASMMRLQLAIQTLLMFFVPAWVVYRMLSRDGMLFTQSPFRTYWLSKRGVMLSVLLSILALPLVSFLGAWNASWSLPEWALMMEQNAKLMTEFILKDANGVSLVVNLVVCAALPAVAEEFFFRGVLQTSFERSTGRSHLAIWLAAIIFSFFHLQFGGFIPRLFLGLVMGYLYYFGRNLWLPILAHFTNNAVAVLAYFIETRYASVGIKSKAIEHLFEAFGILHILSLLVLSWIIYVAVYRVSRKAVQE